jgi:arylsulfatase A-like enzyme
VVICVDTLRGDRLGYQGYERDTSPKIDALAERGARFRYCFSAYPQTAPSVASLFTSLYPSAHKKTEEPGITLTSSVALLAQTFRQAGYRTAAVATNPHLSPGFGYEQGFQHFCYVAGTKRYSYIEQERTYAGTETEIRHSDAAEYGQGDAANAAALDWLDTVANEGAPFFLYLHYMDVHSPYVSPAPYQAMFVEEPGQDRYCNGVPRRPVSERDLGYMQGAYDGQIRYLDELLAALLGELERRDLVENTYIVFLADHGDEFLEHGGLGHGETLFRELLHVPLFLVGPGIPARELESVASTLDVYPTLCELAGLAIPAHLQGQSLVPLLRGSVGAARPSRAVFAECASARLRSDTKPAQKRPATRTIGRTVEEAGPGYSVVDDEWHLIHRPSSGRSELYRYRSDPAEAHDVSAAQPAEVARLLACAEEVLQESLERGRAIQTETTDVDASTRAELEALGYGGEGGDEGGAAEGDGEADTDEE